jgi:hypothetical protein
MNWLELTENPKAVTSLFDLPPALEDVEVMSIKLNRDGPTVELALDLREFPNSPPSRWKRSAANTVTLTLQLLGIGSIALNGWSATNNARVSIRRDDHRIEVTAEGPTTQIRCLCDFIRISGVSAYRQETSAKS